MRTLTMPDGGKRVNHVNLGDLKVGSFVAIKDRNGVSIIRVGEKSPDSLSSIRANIIYPSGFGRSYQNLPTARIPSSNNHLGECYFQEIEAIKVFGPQYRLNDVSPFTDPSQIRLFELPRQIATVEEIKIEDIPEGDRYFIVDSHHFLRILVFGKKVNDSFCEVNECYRSGLTQKVLISTHYLSLKDQLKADSYQKRYCSPHDCGFDSEISTYRVYHPTQPFPPNFPFPT